LAERTESKASYGWIIVVASFLAMSVHGLFFSFGVFYKPLMEHFRWTATQVALAPSTMSIVYILSVLPVSLIYKCMFRGLAARRKTTPVKRKRNK